MVEIQVAMQLGKIKFPAWSACAKLKAIGPGAPEKALRCFSSVWESSRLGCSIAQKLYFEITVTVWGLSAQPIDSNQKEY